MFVLVYVTKCVPVLECKDLVMQHESHAECKLCIVRSQFLGHGSHKITLTTNYAHSKQGCSTKYLVAEWV